MTEKDLASMTDEELAKIGLKRFDIADYLETEEDIVEYLNQVLADGDAAELARALGIRFVAQREPLIPEPAAAT